jgi:hypothetical protein
MRIPNQPGPRLRDPSLEPRPHPRPNRLAAAHHPPASGAVPRRCVLTAGRIIPPRFSLLFRPEDLVHDLSPGRDHRPQLAPVYDLGRPRACVPGQPRDLLHDLLHRHAYLLRWQLCQPARGSRWIMMTSMNAMVTPMAIRQLMVTHGASTALTAPPAAPLVTDGVSWTPACGSVEVATPPSGPAVPG